MDMTDHLDSDVQTLAINAADVEKRYGGTLALNSVSVAAARGTIHALVGENGAGKSTFLGVIAGRVTPSQGTVRIFGEPHAFGSPRSAKAHGISAIYQELTIVPAMSAMANVYLGHTLSNAGLLNNRAMLAGFKDIAHRLGVHINPHTPAGKLSVADQQMLEIMRGVISDARILLFDEPTAALAPPERQALFRIMRQLRSQGVTMMLVSHNLEEVLDISDNVTVFREGKVVASEPVASWTKTTLVRAMIGHDIKPPPARIPRLPRSGTEPLLSARRVSLAGAIDNIDIDVQAGEIVGIGGLVGSGRSSLLRCLAGLEPHSQGDMRIDGKSVEWPHSPRAALRHGIALVPEDRKHQGLVLGRSSVDNIIMTDFSKAARFGVLNTAAMQKMTREVAREFGFNEARINQIMRNLSGGNQQKMLLGKWFYRQPRLLLVDEPTRGIDIGAKEEIMITLRRMADRGIGIVVVSSELEEIVAISDQVLVLSGGHRAANLTPPRDDITVQAILTAAFKLKEDDHAESNSSNHRRS
jgi:ABC-type sugar transport system ATPase subunit